HHWSVGVGQEHAPEPDRTPRSTDLRERPRAREEDGGPVGGRTHRFARADAGLYFPVSSSDQRADGDRKCPDASLAERRSGSGAHGPRRERSARAGGTRREGSGASG